jgi:hypothetical protein
VATGGDFLLDYYKRDPTQRGASWTLAADCTTAETNVPKFLHIPLVLFEMIRKEGRPLMPHDILALLLCYVKNSPPEQAQGVPNTWQMVTQWCIMAPQKDPQGNSLVAFAIEAITKTDNAYFNQWVKSHLDSTMGTRPKKLPHPGVPMAGTSTQVLGHFAAELGKGVALGLQALGPFKPSTGNQGGVTEANSKQMYGEENIAALMGFSHVQKGSNLQDIWMYFQSLLSCPWK